MRRIANPHKVLLLITLLFVIFAAFSFAAFRGPQTFCTDAFKKCSESGPCKPNGSGMLWDDFSRRFVSVVSCR